MKSVIYVLTDPFSKEARYVGQTRQNMRQRFAHHMESSRNMPVARRKWIFDLKSQGSRPDVIILDECPTADGDESERFWIAYLGSLGANLLNITFGGKAGARGHKLGAIHTAESKRKLSEAMTGRIVSDDTREKLSKIFKGRISPNKGKSIACKPNSTGFRGVCSTNGGTRFTSVVRFNGKAHYQGCFKTAIEAAEAYDKKALELFGPTAILNFPETHTDAGHNK